MFDWAPHPQVLGGVLRPLWEPLPTLLPRLTRRRHPGELPTARQRGMQITKLILIAGINKKYKRQKGQRTLYSFSSQHYYNPKTITWVMTHESLARNPYLRRLLREVLKSQKCVAELKHQKVGHLFGPEAIPVSRFDISSVLIHSVCQL